VFGWVAMGGCMYLGGTGWRIVTAASVASRDWERTLIWQLYRHSTSGPTAAESVSVSERQGRGRKEGVPLRGTGQDSIPDRLPGQRTWRPRSVPQQRLSLRRVSIHHWSWKRKRRIGGTYGCCSLSVSRRMTRTATRNGSADCTVTTMNTTDKTL